MRQVAVIVGVLSFIIVVLGFYLYNLQRQLVHMNRQLDKRLTERTRQIVSIDLFNKRLNDLAININKCLKVEENLRLQGMREEKNFKELIANISHDLRTPLAAIKGYQQLLEKGDLTLDQRNKLNTAQKHVNDLERLIRQFFEYSYLLSKESQQTIEPINLTNFTAECLVESIAVFEKKGLSVSFEESPPVFALADKEKLARVMQNLISNCIAHAGGDVTVKISAKEHAMISFQNPIKKDSKIDVERLFDRFYTADQARSQTSGLGLSIVKLLVEQMGGKTEAVLQGDLLDIRLILPRYEK
ncbi:sensor histidine kinase [Bacillus horti]|uniref:histidine kinase n=1 Tax=Caldalkalibacillus horti TaxID=77523 RepID=A0ABT9W0F9_9BACI|nr:HAMP domain-containing sensor histidine kinase [Bacillus horti]MDQ0166724.1 signal transduction histidine kinase [Bacillus horti]